MICFCRDSFGWLVVGRGIRFSCFVCDREVVNLIELFFFSNDKSLIGDLLRKKRRGDKT